MKTSISILQAALSALLALQFVSGCSASGKLEQITKGSITASLTLPSDADRRLVRGGGRRDGDADSGRGVFVMDALRDEDTGEMVATERLDAAVLVARFRNVAERHGMVDMEFMIAVSDTLQDPSWQLRFSPVVQVLDDTLHLDPIFITGEDFRRAQLKGYDRYSRFLKSISRDSTLFVDRAQAGAFMLRNPDIPSSEVENHYRRRMVQWSNSRKLSRKAEMQRRCIRTPIDPQFARLDSVCSGKRPFFYLYSFSVPTRPGLKRITVRMDGAIYGSDRLICTLPSSEPVTFYVSSLSTLVDTTVRFFRKDTTAQAPCERDTAYMRAVSLLEGREYEKALAILAPYADYNAAVAYLALDYNATAAGILESLPPSAPVSYMLALSYSRRGRENEAVESLLRAVEVEPSYRYRGNLDPEIAAIIRKYRLFED